MKHTIELPRHYIITGEKPVELIVDNLLINSENTSVLLQLRAKQLSTKVYESLAKRAIEALRGSQSPLLLNAPPELALKLNADGVHLTAERLMRLEKRPLPKKKLIAASCHNEQELIHAQAIGVDFVTLSPVKRTDSHPDTTPLGWERFGELLKVVSLPVFALGGMMPDDLDRVLACGGYGVAGIRQMAR